MRARERRAHSRGCFRCSAPNPAQGTQEERGTRARLDLRVLFPPFTSKEQILIIVWKRERRIWGGWMESEALVFVERVLLELLCIGGA